MKYPLILSLVAIALSACNQATYTQQSELNNHSIHTTEQNKNLHSIAYQQSMNTMHQDMMRAIQERNPDRAFALGMIPHHQGAIEMAKVQLQYGKNTEMRQLAQAILNNQQPEINLMQNWLKTAPITIPLNTRHSTEYANMNWHDQMNKGIQADNPDRAFALGMIPHHQGAVKMAQIELKYGSDPKMRQLAQAIISAQEPEIKQMQNWLRQNPK